MKILIFEDYPSLQEILKLFKELEHRGLGPFELDVAVSPVEAEARLEFVDLAILDVTNQGRELACRAFNTFGIPVIGLTMNDEDEGWWAPNGSQVMFKLDPMLLKKIEHAVRDCSVRTVVSDASLERLSAMAITAGYNN